MTIKQQGGIFGRNPSFNDVEVDDLTVTGSSTLNGAFSVQGTAGKLNQTAGGNLLQIANGLNTEAAVVQVGSGRSGDGFAYIDLFGTSGATFNARLIRNGGTNGATFLQAKGTGGLAIRTDDAADVIIQTGGAEAARFNTSGNLAFPSGQGIDFSATSGTGTSELFDDYEEGEVNLSTTDANVDIEGNYVKAGRMVTVTLAINPASGDTTWATGDTITGLPYAAATTSSAAGGSYTGGQYYGGYMMTATTMRGRFYVSGTSLTIIDGFGTSTNYSASFTYISET